MCDGKFGTETPFYPSTSTFSNALLRAGGGVPGIETRLRTGRSGVQILVGERDCALLQKSRSSLGPTQLPVQWVPVPFPDVKGPEHKVNHSFSSSSRAEVEWNFTSTFLVCLRIVERECFTFTLARKLSFKYCSILIFIFTVPFWKKIWETFFQVLDA
jgi:hypothetical protein